MRLKISHLVGVVALSLGLGLAGSVEAAPITFSGAPTGMTWSIQSVVQTTDLFSEAPTPINDTYLITLQLVTTTAYSGSPAYLQSVSLDVGSALTLNGNAVLDSSTGGFSWVLGALDKGIGSNGKCNSNQDGAVCIEEDPGTTPNLFLDASGTYSWVFKVDLGTSGLSAVPTLQFATADLKANNTWENTTLSSTLTGSGALSTALVQTQPPVGAAVPEPGSMVLLGTGLLGLAAYARRQRNKRRA